MRERLVLTLLIGLVLVAVGWFGGGFLGFLVGALLGLNPYLSSLVSGIVAAVLLPAIAFYRYQRSRSN